MNITAALLHDTAPDPHNWLAAIDAFHASPTARVLSASFDAGKNVRGTGFTADFRLVDGDMLLTLTPENRTAKNEAGERFTNLRKSMWLSEAWRIRREAGENPVHVTS